MKKIAKKLIFSSLALGASVLTLTTTTYAWYVQNNTATATNITASTADNDSDSLFISTYDPEHSSERTWRSKIDLAANTNNLIPVSLKSGYTGFTADQFCLPTDAINAAPTTAAPVDKAKLATVTFVLTSTNSNLVVQPTLIVKNTTINGTTITELPKQTAYSLQGTTGLALGNEFSVDAVKALRMGLVTSGADDSTDFTKAKTYDVYALGKKPKAQPSDTTWTPYAIVDGSKQFGAIEGTIANETVGLYGANAYYKDIVGDAPTFKFDEVNTATAGTLVTCADSARTTTNLTPFKIAKGTEVTVTVAFWLEGTDPDCFDSCAGQNFEFAIDFTKTSTY